MAGIAHFCCVVWYAPTRRLTEFISRWFDCLWLVLLLIALCNSLVSSILWEFNSNCKTVGDCTCMHACLCVCGHVCVCATFNITQPQQICLGDYANACYVRICTSTNVHLKTSPVVYTGCCIDQTEELNLLWQSCPLQMPSVQSSTWCVCVYVHVYWMVCVWRHACVA